VARGGIHDRHEDVRDDQRGREERERSVQMPERRAADHQQIDTGCIQPGEAEQRQARIELLAAVEAADRRRRAAREDPARREPRSIAGVQVAQLTGGCAQGAAIPEQHQPRQAGDQDDRRTDVNIQGGSRPRPAVRHLAAAEQHHPERRRDEPMRGPLGLREPAQSRDDLSLHTHMVGVSLERSERIVATRLARATCRGSA